MTEQPKKTTITLSEEDAFVFRLLKARTGFDLDELFHMLAKEIQVIVTEGIDPKASRLNFMIDADLKNSMVHLRFSPLYMGLEGLTPSQRKDVLRGFDYGDNYEDLREKDSETKQEPHPPVGKESEQ